MKSRKGDFLGIGIGYPQGKWNSQFKEKAVELTAYVFAAWTLLNSQYYFDTKSNKSADDPKSYLKQPKAAQVVSILRLLSIDDTGSELVRNLIQIGTGEGKYKHDIKLCQFLFSIPSF